MVREVKARRYLHDFKLRAAFYSYGRDGLRPHRIFDERDLEDIDFVSECIDCQSCAVATLSPAVDTGFRQLDGPAIMPMAAVHFRSTDYVYLKGVQCMEMYVG